MEEKVKDTIKKYNLIEQGDKIVVGVSGGPDSMCLLDILYKAQRNPEPMGTKMPKETRNQWDKFCGGACESYAEKRG